MPSGKRSVNVCDVRLLDVRSKVNCYNRIAVSAGSLGPHDIADVEVALINVVRLVRLMARSSIAAANRFSVGNVSLTCPCAAGTRLSSSMISL